MTDKRNPEFYPPVSEEEKKLVGKRVYAVFTDFDNGGEEIQIFANMALARAQLRRTLWEQFAEDYRSLAEAFENDDLVHMPAFPKTEEEITDEMVRAFFTISNEHSAWIIDTRILGETEDMR